MHRVCVVRVKKNRTLDIAVCKKETVVIGVYGTFSALRSSPPQHDAVRSRVGRCLHVN